MKALIIIANGDVIAEKVDDYDRLRELVGGDVEALLCGHAATAYINENGKAEELERNDRATKVINHFLNQLDRCLLPGDFISGTMVIVGKPDKDGVGTDLPEKVVTEIIGLLEIPWKSAQST